MIETILTLPVTPLNLPPLGKYHKSNHTYAAKQYSHKNTTGWISDGTIYPKNLWWQE